MNAQQAARAASIANAVGELATLINPNSPGAQKIQSDVTELIAKVKALGAPMGDFTDDQLHAMALANDTLADAIIARHTRA